EPVSAAPPSIGYKLRKAIQRRRAAVLACMIVLVSLFAATGVSTYFAMRESAALARERQQRRRAEGALREESRQRGLADQRAAETKQIARFQSEWFTGIDPPSMGQSIVKDFRVLVALGLKDKYVGEWPNRRKLTREEIASELAAFDRIAASVRPAEVA